MKYAIIVFLGAILVAIGVYLQTKEQYKLSMQLSELSNENVKLSKANIKLNEKLQSVLTGGDSFCYLESTFVSPKDELIYLYPRHKGKYPLRDVEIVITDLDLLIKTTNDYIKNSKPNVSINEMMNLQSRARYKFEMKHLFSIEESDGSKTKYDSYAPSIFLNYSSKGDKKLLKYSISISARNGVFFQQLRLFFLKENFIVSATKVKKLGEKKPFYLHVDEKFPRNENGKVDW